MAKAGKDYKIVFEKLVDTQKESSLKKGDLATVITEEEAGEIAELHRFIVEFQDEEPQSFTTT